MARFTQIGNDNTHNQFSHDIFQSHYQNFKKMKWQLKIHFKIAWIINSGGLKF
jgi:hypothetical protein